MIIWQYYRYTVLRMLRSEEADRLEVEGGNYGASSEGMGVVKRKLEKRHKESEGKNNPNQN